MPEIDPFKDVLRKMLHDRGVEVTPGQLRHWLEEVNAGYGRQLGITRTHDAICVDLLNGDGGLTNAFRARWFSRSPGACD